MMSRVTVAVFVACNYLMLSNSSTLAWAPPRISGIAQHQQRIFKPSLPKAAAARRAWRQPFPALGASTRSSGGGDVSSPAVDDMFPVLSRIEGINWSGECRYTGADLRPAKDLKLVGGVRYDIDGSTCTLSSFLTFPNGKTREVVMRGERGSLDRPSMRLDSPEEDGGPIYMVLTEMSPDTVLINEVEKASGKVILTASLSLVNKGKELVQVAHEVGDGVTPIEGHQVWRLKQAPIHFDDFDVRGSTGR